MGTGLIMERDTGVALTTAEEWRDLLAATSHHCTCPAGLLARRLSRCPAHRLVDDTREVSRLIFYRRYAMALRRGEWMHPPHWHSAGWVGQPPVGPPRAETR